MSVEPIEILLAEDNDDDVVMIRKTFEQSKIMNMIQVVKDGEEALAYLRREGKYKEAKLPGMLMLDIKMPKKDGLEVLREVKADPNFRHLPIIMLTTSKREEDVLESYQGGACSYISKPLGLQNFQEVIRQFELYWTLVSKIPTLHR